MTTRRLTRVLAGAATLGLLAAGCASDSVVIDRPPASDGPGEVSEASDATPSSGLADDAGSADDGPHADEPGTTLPSGDPVGDRVDTSTTDPVDDTMPPAQSVEVVEPGRAPATSPFADDELTGWVQDLVVWRDGFLAIRRADVPRPLTELPPAIAEQFPAEIRDLFPDGLPGTVDEAIAVVEDAGLIAEAAEAVESIPGAYDAIFGTEMPAGIWQFAASADGAVWERLDVTLPDGIAEISDVATVGDRLVVVGHRPFTEELLGPVEVTVAWTDDLESWETAVVAAERPVDLPEEVSLEMAASSVVANETGWMVDSRVFAEVGGVDLPSDPSPELLPYVVQDVSGWPQPVSSLWFGAWDGEPVATDPVPADATPVVDSVVVATSGGFVFLGQTAGSAAGVDPTADTTAVDGIWAEPPAVASHTADGVEWVERSLPDRVAWWPWSRFVQPLTDGFVLVVGDDDSVAYRVDARAETWTRIEVPGLPAGGYAQSVGADGYVVDAYVGNEGELEQWIVATPDGERWYLERYNTFDPDDVNIIEPAPGGFDFRVAALHDDLLLVGDAVGSGDWYTLTF